MQTITPLTLQQVFDKALAGVRGQNYQPAIFPGGACTYLDQATGNRCAIGHCLPDDVMQQVIDEDVLRSSVGTLMCYVPAVKDLFALVNQADLAALQAFHDDLSPYRNEASPQTYEFAMQRFASERGLTYTPPYSSPLPPGFLG